MQDTQVQSLGWEDTLEKETATHFSILPGKSMDREAWWVQSIRWQKTQTPLSDQAQQ